ncbi:acetylcholine receptor subunit beta-type unc-29-like [Babylonia areolata]|uniref:acetylcholine receptor subunit beta-type unc-29-like n=1 Tax=Babylonia areolata TaxID=304850 RepID=UPI003FD3018A
MFLSCQTTESVTTAGTGSDVIQGSSDVDRRRLTATARLHDDIRRHPVVKQRVAPVTTLASGDVKVDVNVSIHVGSVLYLNDAEQTMTCSTYIVVKWQDISLVWNPEDYGNVSKTEMSPDSVWKPTLILINSQDPVNIMSHTNILFIHSNGTVEAQIYYKTVTLCTMDHSEFPYDTQQCGFILESPSGSCNVILNFVIMDQSDAANLILKSDWLLVSVEHVEIYSTTEMTYFPSMQLQLQRRTVYFTVCLVLPMVVTSYMNSLVFLLPVQCGEKVSFLVSLFVSTSIFISFFQEMMPRGLSTVPTTMKLLLGVLAESLLVLLATLLASVLEVMGRGCKPQVSGNAELSARAESECQHQLCWDNQRLDRLFFLVAFVTNTVYLAILFFE